MGKAQYDLNVLQKSYDQNDKGFKDQSEFIHYCIILGVERLMNDNKIDKRLNLDKIKKLLEQINLS